VATLRENLDRLGVSIAECQQHDWLAGDAPAEEGFDAILVDAPCSNTGVMRRRIDVRWRLTPDHFLRLAAGQLEIVRATVGLLKPGATLLYSTCSIEPEENEEVVRRVLASFPFLELVDQVSILPFRDGFDGAFAARFLRRP
jgi:16S rRNA (cytosine967-C5)-methyltransferase